MRTSVIMFKKPDNFGGNATVCNIANVCSTTKDLGGNATVCSNTTRLHQVVVCDIATACSTTRDWAASSP